jgi:plastocyanin
VDIQQGPDGAMYVADWYNPVKGHAQYSLRDTRRDKKSGRIWRITAKDQKLEEAPKIAGEPVEELVKLVLTHPVNQVRESAKVELRNRGEDDIDLIGMAMLTGLGAVPSLEPGYGERIEKQWKENPLPVLELIRMTKWLATQNVNTQGIAGGFITTILQSKNHLARAAATNQLRWFFDDVEDRSKVFRDCCNDPSGLVRLEAAIAASYIGTPEALEAALDLLKHPMDPYLTYALRTSLDSHTLQPLWKGNTAFLAKHPELGKFLKDSEPTKPALMAKKKKPEPPNPFDNQPGLQTITIKTIPERLLYDLREFKVAPGAPVKLVFENPDVTPHNLLIVQPGAADEVGMAGNEMAKTPDGFAKGFIPDSPKILHKTKMLNQGDSETLRFTAPTSKGKYPYICTFPGHWLVMKGEMVVE